MAFNVDYMQCTLTLISMLNVPIVLIFVLIFLSNVPFSGLTFFEGVIEEYIPVPNGEMSCYLNCRSVSGEEEYQSWMKMIVKL